MQTINLKDYKPFDDATESEQAEYSKLCISCGACCSYYAYRQAEIAWDERPLPVELVKLTYRRKKLFLYIYEDGQRQVHSEDNFWMRTKALNGWKACIALTGTIGIESKCSIYDLRPAGCRNFQPGSSRCKQIREWAFPQQEGE